MASRFMRGTAIAVGAAALTGVGLGWAAGEPADPADLPPPRKLPADLCARLGDVGSLLPTATKPAPRLSQTNGLAVRCRVEVKESTQPTHTAASLDVVITPYGAKVGGAGAPPIPPETVARQTFDRKPLPHLNNRPYSTKLDQTSRGPEQWRVTVLVLRADLVVQVDYAAQPVEQATAEKAALAMADRAVWEAK